MDLRGLQNFAGAFCTGDVRACADFAPAIERTGDPNLCPDSKNCRNNQVEKEMMTAKADWIEHACGNLVALFRRSSGRLVHLVGAIDLPVRLGLARGRFGEPPLPPRLDLQLVGKSRENLAASLRYHDHVFVPDAAESGIIEARLNRHHLSIFQHHFLQSWIFVNLKSEPVSGAVEKSHVLSFSNFSRVAALFEKRLDRLVNYHSVDPGFDFAKREFLSVFDGLPEFALRIARASSNNRARHVAPITALGIARKNIENDQRVREKRTRAAL